MQDEAVRGAGPTLRREQRTELCLDLDRVFAFGETDAIGDAQHVSVHRKPGNAERVSEDDVRRLASDTGQRRQRVHVRRHLPAVLLDQCGRHPDQRLRLRAEEAGRVDLRLEFVGRRLGQCRRIRIPLEQRRRDHVHALIGRLRRQDGGRQQLEGVREMEFRVSARMLLVERIEDRDGVP